MSKETIEQQIKELQDKLTALKKEEEQLQKLAEPQRLAENLHSMLCRGNHIDVCAWDYEKWDNPGYAKQQWLDKAVKLLRMADYDLIVRIVKEL